MNTAQIKTAIKAKKSLIKGCQDFRAAIEISNQIKSLEEDLKEARSFKRKRKSS